MPRARDLGLVIGQHPPGPLNAITDVAGVAVGHLTLIKGERTRTGATAIVPHPGNAFADKVPAGIAVLNGYGKFAGSWAARSRRCWPKRWQRTRRLPRSTRWWAKPTTGG